MVKKTLLSLAIAASTAGLTACNISSTSDSSKVDTTPVDAGQPGFEASTTAVVFAAARGNIPVATDFVFADAATSDGTANTDDTTPPVTTAINKLAGFSTTASMDIAFSASLDPATIIEGSSVFLVAFNNSDDVDALDLNAILAAFPTAPFAETQPAPGVDYIAEYVEMDDGATPTIRIHPTKPLDPKTKYLVIITDKLMDTKGVSVVASSEYALTSGTDELFTPSLEPVRTAIQGWEQLAGLYLGNVGQTQDNIILSYAFTTNSGPDILKQYAAPSLFIADQLPLASAEGLVDTLGGTTDAYAKGVAQAMMLDPNDPAVIASIKASPTYAPGLYSYIAAADLTDLVGAPLTINGVVDRPAPRQVDLIDATTVDGSINAARDLADPDNAPYTGGASPATFLGTTDVATRYIQGQIQLPDFLGEVTLTTELTPEGIPAAMAADSPWTANITLGAILDGALGQPAGTTPPKDVDGETTNVTYRYPFPQSVGTDYSPVMITMPAAFDYSMGGANPAGSDCTSAAPFPVVMYVHGITGARTNGLAYSAGLAANCIATVAIDLPLHGIAPLTTDSDGADVANAVLPFTAEPGLAAFTSSPYAGVAAGSGATFENLTEQHDSITQNSSGVRHAMNFDASVGDVSGQSGSAIINLYNFTRSRDNIQQAVVDLLNLNASLANIDTALGGGKLDTAKVFVAGHSLGAIFATTYVAVNNDPTVLAANTNLNEIQGVMLANGGGQITKLLENSPSFGPTILGSLAGAGLTQGSSDLEKYFSVLQASIDSVDPVMTGSLLAATDTPIVLFNMVGGDALPTDETELAAISYPAGFKGQGSYLADHTVPNFDYFADAATNPYAAFAPALGLQAEAPSAKAVMAGTNGLATIMGLEVVNKDTVIGELTSPTQVVSRFSTGTHSTFANSDAPAAFTEMLTQSITLINGSFTSVNTAVLEASN